MRLLHRLSAPRAVLTLLALVFVPASAQAGSVTLTSPTTFKVLFGGNIDQQNVPDLSSEATFHFLGFSTSGNTTKASFDVTLTNTTASPLSSRVSGLGFDVSPDAQGGTVSGVFDKVVLGGSFPNQFGAVDVCVNGGNGKNCQGGANGGVTTGSSSFLLDLFFSGSVSQIVLDNFGVRYQSIDGKSVNGTKYKDASGTGVGVPGPGPDPTVPEPANLLLFGVGLTAIGATLRRRRRAREQQSS